MKIILRFSLYAILISAGFAFLYHRGYSETLVLINVYIFGGIAVFESGLQYGFTRALPKQKPGDIMTRLVIRLVRYGFAFTLFFTAEDILNVRFVESFFSSKRFVFVLWLMIIFEMFLWFVNTYKRRTLRPAGTAPPEDQAAG